MTSSCIAFKNIQELHSQAPWLYPGGHMMFPPIQVQPPLARPLILDQEERRLQENPNVGDQPPVAYPYMVPQAFHANAELRRGLEVLMAENRKLRERIELFENSNGKEDQKFSTPNGESKERDPEVPQKREMRCSSMAGVQWPIQIQRVSVLIGVARMPVAQPVFRLELSSLSVANHFVFSVKAPSEGFQGGVQESRCTFSICVVSVLINVSDASSFCLQLLFLSELKLCCGAENIAAHLRAERPGGGVR